MRSTTGVTLQYDPREVIFFFWGGVGVRDAVSRFIPYTGVKFMYSNLLSYTNYQIHLFCRLWGGNVWSLDIVMWPFSNLSFHLLSARG